MRGEGRARDDDALRGVAWVGPTGRWFNLPNVAISGPSPGALFRDALAIRRAGVRLALVSAESERLRDVAAACTLGGVSAVVGFLERPPPGGPPPVALKWYARRVHRFVCADAEIARLWGRAGIALGRIVVVPTGVYESEALAAILREVGSMGG